MALIHEWALKIPLYVRQHHTTWKLHFALKFALFRATLSIHMSSALMLEKRIICIHSWINFMVQLWSDECWKRIYWETRAQRDVKAHLTFFIWTLVNAAPGNQSIFHQSSKIHEAFKASFIDLAILTPSHLKLTLIKCFIAPTHDSTSSS